LLADGHLQSNCQLDRNGWPRLPHYRIFEGRSARVGEFVSVFVFEGGQRERVAARVARETGANSRRNKSIPTFDHHRLDAFSVAREALRLGDALARRLPRGYATLADQLRRALLSAFLGIAEAASRAGADRLSRFRCSRGEASEAAAALEAIQVLHLFPDGDVEPVVALLDRLCARLTRLGGLSHQRGLLR